MRKSNIVSLAGLAGAAALLLFVSFVAGCGNRTDGNGTVEQQYMNGTYDRALQDPEIDLGRNYGSGGQMNIPDQMNRISGADRNNVEVAEEAADKVASLDFVRSAYVLKTENNALVAALLEQEGDLSRHMEDQVARAVRSVDDSIQHVYVSTNPSFLDRVDNYIDDIREGRPIEGFVEEFSEMIDRIFPNAR